MATTYCGRYMRVFVATTQLQERWWGKHTELISGGPPQFPMLRILCGGAKTANFSANTRVLAHSLITIPPSWPFACWSLDMIGPFTTAPGGFTHVLLISSLISCIASASRIPSSRTWDQTSRPTSSGSSMKMRASRSNMSLLHTQGPTVKSRGQMA
jgi:hypothetical protein